jgi:formate hydrogenlyase subunit 3/multisubunit Na+/H+ antiporter MnhD subunit
MITGIGIGTPLGITAGLLHCLNHGFFKGGLFLSAGSVQHATGTRDMNQLGGLAQKHAPHDPSHGSSAWAA